LQTLQDQSSRADIFVMSYARHDLINSLNMQKKTGHKWPFYVTIVHPDIKDPMELTIYTMSVKFFHNTKSLTKRTTTAVEIYYVALARRSVERRQSTVSLFSRS
jgi:hypothetical protein